MKHRLIILAALILIGGLLQAQTKQWSLQDCLDYALKNNIQLQKSKVSLESSKVDVKSAKAALFPSLSFSTSQGVTHTPWSESSSFINESGGTMTSTSTSDKVTANGSYGLNASWTLWNGNQNRNNLKQQKLNEQVAQLSTEQTANSIQEEIAQDYVQILYEVEEIKIAQSALTLSKTQRDRGAEMVKTGSLAKADLAQLEAQVTQDQYTLVNAQSLLASYKLKLKQLLEIDGGQSFDVTIPDVNDNQVLASIPTLNDVYQSSLVIRPEIKSGQISIDNASLAIKTAKGGYYPTLSLSAGLGSSDGTALSGSLYNQLKHNFNSSVSLNVSVPIFDNRKNKSNVEKAKLNYITSQLDLQSTQKTLYSTIEGYWQDATTSQMKYIAAKANVESMQTSYDLVSEQFRVGLKNVVDMLTGKNNLLSAQQSMLQSKYTSLLNLTLLRFYQGDKISI